MIVNPLAILIKPREQWSRMAQSPLRDFDLAALYPVILALLPAVAWYYGTAKVGWTVGDGDITRLTEDSAFRIICAFYGAMVISIIVIGSSIHWLSRTFGTETSVAKGIAIAGMASTPLYFAGASGFYPILWLDLVLGTLAMCWAIYLLLVGVPIVMKISEEQGFLYSSMILTASLVIFICILVATALLWDMGFMPVFTD